MAAITSAVVAATATSYAHNRSLQHADASARLPVSGLALIPATRTGKCQSCGSRQFREHQSRHICAYCRSEQ